MTIAEKAWSALTEYKNLKLISLDKITPEIDFEIYRKDMACLIENMSSLLDLTSGEIGPTIISSCAISYSELFAHRLVSVQPLVIDHPVFFLNNSNYQIQYYPWSGSTLTVPLSYRFNEHNLSKENPDFINNVEFMMASIAMDWDYWALESIIQISGYNREIDNEFNLYEELESLVDRVSNSCNRPVNWLVTNKLRWEEITNKGHGIELYDIPKRWFSAVSYGTWNGISVYLSTLPSGVLAVCGHRGNTLFDSGLVLSPYTMAEIDTHDNFFATYFNVKYRKPGNALNGKAARTWCPNGESFYGTLFCTNGISSSY